MLFYRKQNKQTQPYTQKHHKNPQTTKNTHGVGEGGEGGKTQTKPDTKSPQKHQNQIILQKFTWELCSEYGQTPLGKVIPGVISLTSSALETEVNLGIFCFL